MEVPGERVVRVEVEPEREVEARELGLALQVEGRPERAEVHPRDLHVDADLLPLLLQDDVVVTLDRLHREAELRAVLLEGPVGAPPPAGLREEVDGLPRVVVERRGVRLRRPERGVDRRVDVLGLAAPQRVAERAAVADADDDLAPGTSEFQVADRLGCLVEAVGPVDDRHDLSVVCQLRKDEQVGTARSGRERDDPVAREPRQHHGSQDVTDRPHPAVGTDV